jgi:hypothetical protein
MPVSPTRQQRTCAVALRAVGVHVPPPFPMLVQNHKPLVSVGGVVGAGVGTGVGDRVGPMGTGVGGLGAGVGRDVGAFVGLGVGAQVGLGVGFGVGAPVTSVQACGEVPAALSQ